MSGCRGMHYEMSCLWMAVAISITWSTVVHVTVASGTRVLCRSMQPLQSHDPSPPRTARLPLWAKAAGSHVRISLVPFWWPSNILRTGKITVFLIHRICKSLAEHNELKRDYVPAARFYKQALSYDQNNLEVGCPFPQNLGHCFDDCSGFCEPLHFCTFINIFLLSPFKGWIFFCWI